MAKDYRTAKREAVRKAVLLVLKRGKPTSIAAVAKGLRMPESTVRYHINSFNNLREKLAALGTAHELSVVEMGEQERRRIEIAKYRGLYRKVVADNVRLRREIIDMEHAKEYARMILPANYHIDKTHGGKGATAMALLGDWHVDERVSADAVNDVNEYTPEIAERRIGHLYPAIVNLLDMCRKKSKIDRLVLVNLGDFASNWIHDDLMQDSAASPPESVMRVLSLMSGGIDHILEHAGLKELLIVCVCGNHGRITRKIPVKQSAEKNYEWLLYQILAMQYADRLTGKTRIAFKLPQGYFNWLSLYGREIRIHHGDAIRYHGGTGGITVPMYRAIADWNTARHADLDIFGHHHMRQQPLGAIINGSVIGYSELAIRLHCKHQRPQQFFYLEHERFGPTAQFPIILE